jgi:hypothetical protein
MWSGYPKKQAGRKLARTEIAKLSIAEWETLKRMIPGWLKHWQSMESRGELQYVPNLARWVKSGAFEAEAPTETRAAPTVNANRFTRPVANEAGHRPTDDYRFGSVVDYGEAEEERNIDPYTGKPYGEHRL